MTTEERIDMALNLRRQADNFIILATEAADPVAERRNLARAAARFRDAANLLDDDGRHDPDWGR